MSEFIFSRVWAMPSRWTFTIKPIAQLLKNHASGVIVDPFCGQSVLGTLRNDIEHQDGKDALLWLQELGNDIADTILFDPPYSMPQHQRRYKNAHKTISWTSKAYWARCKDELSRVLKPGGKAICFGWNSNGLGKVRGCRIIELLLVPHGGDRHDTIVTVEIKE